MPPYVASFSEKCPASRGTDCHDKRAMTKKKSLSKLSLPRTGQSVRCRFRRCAGKSVVGRRPLTPPRAAFGWLSVIAEACGHASLRCLIFGKVSRVERHSDRLCRSRNDRLVAAFFLYVWNCKYDCNSCANQKSKAAPSRVRPCCIFSPFGRTPQSPASRWRRKTTFPEVS